MQIYVAGKTHDYPIVRNIQGMVRDCGHTITHDWTHAVESVGPGGEHTITAMERRGYAQADMDGVLAADLVIALGHPALCGTLIEIGMALGHGTPVWAIDILQRSVFWDLPGVTSLIFPDLQGCIERLAV